MSHPCACIRPCAPLSLLRKQLNVSADGVHVALMPFSEAAWVDLGYNSSYNTSFLTEVFLPPTSITEPGGRFSWPYRDPVDGLLRKVCACARLIASLLSG